MGCQKRCLPSQAFFRPLFVKDCGLIASLKSERFAIIKSLNGGKISAAVASPSSFQAIQHTLGDSRLT
jgi:hypothetical protein